MPRLPSTTAHSIPAGPAPTTSTSLPALAAGENLSGCQPRRYSSPAVAFWVHQIGRRLLPAGDADVAADALADVVEPPLLDLSRQERVGDRRAGGADDVALPGADRLDHDVGIGEAPDADHGLRRRRTSHGCAWAWWFIFEETRWAGVLAPVSIVPM